MLVTNLTYYTTKNVISNMEQKEINLDTLFANKHAEPTETVLVVEEQKYVDFGRILNEVSYKLPKGYPTVVDGVFTEREEIIIINEALEAEGLSTLPLPEANPVKDYQAATNFITSKLTQKILGSDLDKITLRPFITKDNEIRLEVPQVSRMSVASKLALATKGGLIGNKAQFSFNIKGIKYTCVVKPATPETKTDTDVKEGLSVVMSYYPEYLTGNENDKDQITQNNYKEASKKLLQFIKTGAVSGLDETPLDSCVSFLQKGTKLTAPKDIKKYIEK